MSTKPFLKWVGGKRQLLPELRAHIGYAKKGFTLKDQARLRDVAATLKKRGVHVLLSNSDTPATRSLYKGFRMREVSARRSVNSVAGKRGAVGELLIW